MAKARSPEYPAIGLKEAVEKVGMVYNKDYQNKLPKDVIAKHMGYKGLNGGSLPVLAALNKYGLLEGRSDETRVSDLGLAIVAHGAGSPERIQALRTAAANPELFAELDGKFQGGKASDQAIRAYLLTQRFIPSAADTAIRAYRETKQLVEPESGGYDSAQFEPEKPPMMPQPSILDRSPSSIERPPMVQEKFDLDEGTVTITVPSVLSRYSYQDFADRMEILLRGLKRRSDAEESLKE